MNVVFNIDGREAIPVRAIPFIMRWKRWSVGVSILAQSAKNGNPIPAYEIDSGGEVEDFDSLRWGRLNAWPSGVFFYRKDFEKVFGEILDRMPPQGVKIVNGRYEFNYNPDLNDEQRAYILVGFERLLSGPEVSAAPPRPDEVPAPSDQDPDKPQALLLRIVKELERYAEETHQPFNRTAMPGLLGDSADTEGSLHWLCAQLDPQFRKSHRQFERYRAGVCAVEKFATASDFYRQALPHMAPLFASVAPDPKRR